MHNVDVVAEAVVTACLAAVVLKRPVLISSKHKSEAEVHTCAALQSLLGKPCAVIHCTEKTSWLRLEQDIGLSAHTGIVLSNLHELQEEIQLRLVEALHHKRIRDVSLADTIFIATGHQHGIIRYMRLAILFEKTVDFDPDTPLMSLPAAPHASVITSLRPKVDSVRIIGDVMRYMEDLIVFIRSHRLVKGGVSPQVVQDLNLLVRAFCVFEQRQYATPPDVAAAALELIPMKIELVAAANEPSQQWGGNEQVATLWIDNWDTRVLVESVLEQVPPPV